MQRRNFHLASRCPVCREEVETKDHVLYECKSAKEVWNMLATLFKHHEGPSNIEGALRMNKLHSSLVKEIWQACSITTMVQLWKARNKALYGEKATSTGTIMYMCRAAAYHKSDKCMNNNVTDLEILHNLELKTRVKQLMKVMECYWCVPPLGYIKANTDAQQEVIQVRLDGSSSLEINQINDL
ncbi:hypothetical protein FRX31_013394 [Thalictrum thalictroides]|uniref:Reverse transcriptase zinc-binding domain-containing protein n=1 Tax=Thalictrum thalictroides TaxID=46969 RepID=A0A7J6WK98_THATH|nr:hypothetical protein FRX31_013394 [Thalictrum thalictroides]